MEFLDHPYFKLAVIVIGIPMIMHWLFSKIIPMFDKGYNDEQKRSFDERIATLSSEQLAQIEEAIGGNRKLEAIKLFRAATNTGLKEAKDCVEHMIELQKHLSKPPVTKQELK